LQAVKLYKEGSEGEKSRKGVNRRNDFGCGHKREEKAETQSACARLTRHQKREYHEGKRERKPKLAVEVFSKEKRGRGRINNHAAWGD